MHVVCRGRKCNAFLPRISPLRLFMPDFQWRRVPGVAVHRLPFASPPSPRFLVLFRKWTIFETNALRNDAFFKDKEILFYGLRPSFCVAFRTHAGPYRLEAHASGVTFDRCGMAVALCRHYRSGLSRRQPAQDERERNGRRDRTQRLDFSCRLGGGFGRFRTLGTTVDMLPSAGNRNRFKTGSSMDILASLEIRRVSGSELPQRLFAGGRRVAGSRCRLMWTAAGVTAPFSPDAWSANMFCSTPGRLRRRW